MAPSDGVRNSFVLERGVRTGCTSSSTSRSWPATTALRPIMRASSDGSVTPWWPVPPWITASACRPEASRIFASASGGARRLLKKPVTHSVSTHR
jgi:hypothetical protein